MLRMTQQGFSGGDEVSICSMQGSEDVMHLGSYRTPVAALGEKDGSVAQHPESKWEGGSSICSLSPHPMHTLAYMHTYTYPYAHTYSSCIHIHMHTGMT